MGLVRETGATIDVDGLELCGSKKSTVKAMSDKQKQRPQIKLSVEKLVMRH